MSKRFGDARLPSLKDKIRGLEEAAAEKRVKVIKEKGRTKVKVKKLT